MNENLADDLIVGAERIGAELGMTKGKPNTPSTLAPEPAERAVAA